MLSPAVACGRPAPEALNATLDEATTAVALDPPSVEGHLALALAYRGRKRWSANAGVGESISPGFGCPTGSQPAAAEETYREGLRLDPLNGTGYVSLATLRWWMGRRGDALAAIDEGLAAQPQNVVLNATRPFNLLFADRLDEADPIPLTVFSSSRETLFVAAVADCLIQCDRSSLRRVPSPER